MVDWAGYTIGYYGRPFEARNKVRRWSPHADCRGSKLSLAPMLMPHPTCKAAHRQCHRAQRLSVPCSPRGELSQEVGDVAVF